MAYESHHEYEQLERQVLNDVARATESGATKGIQKGIEKALLRRIKIGNIKLNMSADEISQSIEELYSKALKGVDYKKIKNVGNINLSDFINIDDSELKKMADSLVNQFNKLPFDADEKMVKNLEKKISAALIEGQRRGFSSGVFSKDEFDVLMSDFELPKNFIKDVTKQLNMKPLIGAFDEVFNSFKFEEKGLTDLEELLSRISDYSKAHDGKQISGFWDKLQNDIAAGDIVLKDLLTDMGLLEKESIMMKQEIDIIDVL